MSGLVKIRKQVEQNFLAAKKVTINIATVCFRDMTKYCQISYARKFKFISIRYLYRIVEYWPGPLMPKQ